MWTYVPLQTTALLGPNEMCYSLTHTLANSHKVSTLFLKTHSRAAHRLSCSINMSKKNVTCILWFLAVKIVLVLFAKVFSCTSWDFCLYSTAVKVSGILFVVTRFRKNHSFFLKYLFLGNTGTLDHPHNTTERQQKRNVEDKSGSYHY